MERHRGLTLIETVVWIGIATASMIATLSSIQYFYRANAYTVEQADAVASAQRGMERMVRVLREAAYSSDGAYPIEQIDSDGIVFYADVDADAFIEKVRYYIDDGEVKQGVIDASGDPPSYGGTEVETTIATNVENDAENVDLFTYYDAEGNELEHFDNVALVRFIVAQVVVDADPNRLPAPVSLRSSAALRNLR